MYMVSDPTNHAIFDVIEHSHSMLGIYSLSGAMRTASCMGLFDTFMNGTIGNKVKCICEWSSEIQAPLWRFESFVHEPFVDTDTELYVKLIETSVALSNIAQFSASSSSSLLLSQNVSRLNVAENIASSKKILGKSLVSPSQLQLMFDSKIETSFDYIYEKLKQLVSSDKFRVTEDPQTKLHSYHVRNPISIVSHSSFETHTEPHIIHQPLSIYQSIVLDIANRKVVAHSFPKVLDIHSPQTQKDVDLPILLDMEIDVVEKIDGSHILAFNYNGTICTTAKTGMNSIQAKWARERLLSRSKLLNDKNLLLEGYSYVFEAVNRHNNYIVWYPFEDLFLIAAYYPDGKEFTLEELETFSIRLGCRTPYRFKTKFRSLIEYENSVLIRHCDSEGWIILLPNDRRIKMASKFFLESILNACQCHPLAVWNAMRLNNVNTLFLDLSPLGYLLREETLKMKTALTNCFKSKLSANENVLPDNIGHPKRLSILEEIKPPVKTEIIGYTPSTSFRLKFCKYWRAVDVREYESDYISQIPNLLPEVMHLIFQDVLSEKYIDRFRAISNVSKWWYELSKRYKKEYITLWKNSRIRMFEAMNDVDDDEDDEDIDDDDSMNDFW
eukprot:TRINITY_DN2358_c0_g1_i1.p1 TRINITY_DN2358_c0_g1~~TRINITY_DN2358_c0_g1_i1.p1  ORF type:complete len:700 (-),score=108.52 TRINITY_DN2358_c0_g1_i1:101-1936(-)